jgi:lipopolysaccharide export system permease protein
VRDRIDPWPQEIRGDLVDHPSFVTLFVPAKQALLMEKAAGMVRTLKDQAINTEQSLRRTRESRVKHIFEYHTKFNLAVACIVFLFVGAPMGAIVRKGGFGWPMLISIVFFMLFIIINIFSKNIAERSVIYPVPASWMSTLVVFPLGWLLTYWAMRDMGWTHIRDALQVLRPRFVPTRSGPAPEA